MVDVTQPTIFGCAITPWLIIFGICIIDTIVCAVLVITGCVNYKKKERSIIENTVKSTTSASSDDIHIPDLRFGSNPTESIVGSDSGKTYTFETESFINSAVGTHTKTESRTTMDESYGKTEGFDSVGNIPVPNAQKTEGFGRVPDTANKTESISSVVASGMTEGFGTGQNSQARFCAKCGAPVSGGVCSRCGRDMRAPV